MSEDHTDEPGQELHRKLARERRRAAGPHRWRLGKGRFAQIWGDAPMELTIAELQLFLEGLALVGKVRVSPAKLCLWSP